MITHIIELFTNITTIIVITALIIVLTITTTHIILEWMANRKLGKNSEDGGRQIYHQHT